MSHHFDIVVRKLAKLAVVDTDILVVGVDAQRQTRNEVHEEQDETSEAE